MLAKEKVAVVQGCGVEGDEKVVGTRCRSWHILEGETISVMSC